MAHVRDDERAPQHGSVQQQNKADANPIDVDPAVLFPVSKIQ